MPKQQNRSKPAKQYENKNDEQQKADPAVHAVAKSISRATTKSAESAQQEDDENDQ
jgi:hypothetical protein